MRQCRPQSNRGGKVRGSANKRVLGRVCASAAAALAVTALASPALADVVWGDFEMGAAPGFGALTNAGVQPWVSPVAGNVITAPSGPLAGTKVLDLTGSESFNFGQGDGGALGFDFLSQSLRPAFLNNDQIEFDWYPTPNNSAAGYSQLYNVILNSQGGGFVNVDGFSAGNANLNQYYYTGYNGILHHVVINYAAYKSAVLASANPDGGNYLQLGIQPNAGGGAPADYYFDNFKFSIAPNLWNVDADGTWSNAGNWSPVAAPNAADKVASFDAVITAPRTVTVDAPQTIGQINFNNANKYTLAGTSTLTLNSAGSAVGITVSSGSHDINAPLALAKDASISVSSASSTLTLSNLQGSTVGITKTGAGVLTVNNIRAGNLTVAAGTLKMLPSSTAAGVSKVTSLTVNGVLDISNNKLITSNPAGSWNGTAYTGVTGLVATGRGPAASTPHFTATSNAIITSQTQATTSSFTNIGVATAAQVKGIAATATATWAGQTVTGSDTLVMYTYGGDANLDGKINVDDYTRIDFNVPLGTKGWYNGDFNYDGKINVDDYTIIDFNVGIQGAPFFTAGGIGDVGAGLAAVPEPAACSILAATGILALRRVRRRLPIQGGRK